MFHIKTDIRQYKCETEDKVERLIRNWVIRPSDLIYDADDDAWNPIGGHPSFDDVFAVIEAEEANEPDTVVSEAPSAVGADYEVDPGSETRDAAGTEVTDVTDASSMTDDSGDAESSGDEVETTLETTAKIEIDTAQIDTAQIDADDGRPVAPAGVEGLIRDSDEITMMTDKTLAMIRDEDDSDTSAEDDDPVTAEPMSSTNDGASAEASSSGDDGVDDTTDVVEQRDTIPDSTADQQRSGAPDASDAGDADDADKEAASDGPTGRHGLPEEIFVTDEIPQKGFHQAVVDELGELEDTADTDDRDSEVTDLIDDGGPAASSAAPDETADSGEQAGDISADAHPTSDDASQPGDGADHTPAEDTPAEDTPASDTPAEDTPASDTPAEDAPAAASTAPRGDADRKSSWRIVMSDDADDADTSSAESADSAASPPDDAADDAEPTVPDEPAAPDESAASQQSEAPNLAEVEQPAGDGDALDDERPDPPDDAPDVAGVAQSSDPVDIDADNITPVDDDGPAGQRARAETPIQEAEPEIFVSEGYDLALPIDISPSAEDIDLGLVHSTSSNARKNATFPYPEPKRPDEVARRTFDLDPEEPRDQSMLIVATTILVVVVLLIAAIQLFG